MVEVPLRGDREGSPHASRGEAARRRLIAVPAAEDGSGLALRHAPGAAMALPAGWTLFRPERRRVWVFSPGAPGLVVSRPGDSGGGGIMAW